MEFDAIELVTIIQKRHPDSLVFSMTINSEYPTEQHIFIIPVEDIHQIIRLSDFDEYNPEITDYSIVDDDINIFNESDYAYYVYNLANEEFQDYFMEMRNLYTTYNYNRYHYADYVNFKINFKISTRDVLLELLDEYDNSLPVFMTFESEYYLGYWLIQDQEDFVELTKGWYSNFFVKKIVAISNKNGQNPTDLYKETVQVDDTTISHANGTGQMVTFELPNVELVDYFIENMSMSFDYGRPAKAAFA